VHIDAHELVLVAVVALWLACFLLGLFLGLLLLLCELPFLLLAEDALLFLVLLLLLQAAFLAHNFVEGVWLQVEYVRE